MFFLILSVLCSVAVSVLLRRAGPWRIDAAQAVAWNYLVAALLCAAFLHPSLQPLRDGSAPWPELLLLAIALPAIFLVFARTLALAGIVRADAAQRLSLLISLVAAFALFGEPVGVFKLAGLGVGMLALAGILARPERGAGTASWKNAWPWLLATCAGYAGIDILLKRIALSGTSSMSALQACFALAFVLMLGYLFVRRTKFDAHNLVAGLLLGALNFANIFFYVRAHQALPHSPATVFATMNIGVVALGTLAGMLWFKEKTSTWNRAGLVLAVIAIVLAALGAK